jgi:hypothetical protein
MVLNGNINASKDESVRDRFAKSTHLPHSALNQGRGYALLRESAERKRARYNQIQYGTDSMPPNLFSNDNIFFDIRLTGSGVDTLDTITLRIIVQNTDTQTAIKPVLSFFFFDHLEIQPDGGVTEDTIYADQMYIDYCNWVDLEMKATQGYTVGMDTVGPVSTSAPVTSRTAYDEDGLQIPPLGTREYLIPQYGNMFTTGYTFLPNKIQTPRFRWFPTIQPLCTDTPKTNGVPGTITCVGADATIGGVLYDSDLREQLCNFYGKYRTISRVLVHERQLIDLKSITPGQDVSDLTLTVFSGEYAMMFVTLERVNQFKERAYSSNRTYDPTANPPVYHAWLPIARMSLVDSNGNPIAYNNISGSYLRHIYSAECFQGNFLYAQKQIFPWSWTLQAKRTLQYGASLGGIMFDSNFQLKIAPGAIEGGINNESFRVFVRMLRYATLTRTPDGKFELRKL